MAILGLKARRERRQAWNERQREAGRQEGRARARMAAALGDEPVVAQGVIYVDGDSGDHAYTFKLTRSRLLWNRTKNPDVQILLLADVVTFRVVSTSVTKFELRREDGSTTDVVLFPTLPTSGTPRYGLDKDLFLRLFAERLCSSGARYIG